MTCRRLNSLSSLGSLLQLCRMVSWLRWCTVTWHPSCSGYARKLLWWLSLCTQYRATNSFVGSFFFWMATKVHTHNALFIYCQPFEGGGKVFYYWNRIVFVILYTSICIFTGLLALKKFASMALAFFIVWVESRFFRISIYGAPLSFPLALHRLSFQNDPHYICGRQSHHQHVCHPLAPSTNYNRENPRRRGGCSDCWIKAEEGRGREFHVSPSYVESAELGYQTVSLVLSMFSNGIVAVFVVLIRTVVFTTKRRRLFYSKKLHACWIKPQLGYEPFRSM